MSSVRSEHNSSSRRPIPCKLFLLALVVLGASASNAPAQEYSFSGWGPSRQYDNGLNPSVAAYGSTVVEVHNGQGNALWYHVGESTASGTINWGPSRQYDNGLDPSVAMAGSTVVEVHNGQGSVGPMWYHVGQITASGINWGPSVNYDNGLNPSVTMAGSTVVEVHNGQGSVGPMWYHVGQITASGIKWGPSVNYDNGYNPSVTIGGCQPILFSSSCTSTVVEVHNGQGNALWYHVGTWTSGGQSIQWGPSYRYDSGWNPKVAVVAGGFIEVHKAQAGPGALWYHYGQPGNGSAIMWGNSYQYDNGYDPSVAAGNLVVEVHDATNAVGPMWYHTGTIKQSIIP